MTDKRILLVSHAATIIALSRELMGDRAFPLRVGCCSLTEMCRSKGVAEAVGHWEPKRLADGSHLKEGASRDWGFEDIQIADGKVIEDRGQPGTQDEVNEPTGLQLLEVASRM